MDDPDFWEKLGQGMGKVNNSAKHLLKQLRNKKNDLTSTHAAQSKYMKEVSSCIKGLLDAKLADNSREIEEEVFDLLKRLKKSTAFEQKYRDKASVMLSRVLGFDEYQQQLRLEAGEAVDFSRRQRAAKEKVDYTSKGLRKKELVGGDMLPAKRNRAGEGSQGSSASRNGNSELKNGEELLDELDADLEEEKQQKQGLQSRRNRKRQRESHEAI